jgi:hypothetical protein
MQYSQFQNNPMLYRMPFAPTGGVPLPQQAGGVYSAGLPAPNAFNPAGSPFTAYPAGMTDINAMAELGCVRGLPGMGQPSFPSPALPQMPIPQQPGQNDTSQQLLGIMAQMMTVLLLLLLKDNGNGAAAGDSPSEEFPSNSGGPRVGGAGNALDGATGQTAQGAGGTLPPPLVSGSGGQGRGATQASGRGNFDDALKFVLKWEGGLSDHAADPGGRTNKGVTHETYSAWLKKKGLPNKPVDQITDAEVKQIYYEEYWVASGADKIQDPRLALAHFNAAVNMGVGRAEELMKKSGGNPDKYIAEQEALYKRFANNGQGVFLEGWLNRSNDLKKYIANMGGSNYTA